MMARLADNERHTEASLPHSAGRLDSRATEVSSTVEALISAHKRSVQHSQRYFYDHPGVQSMAGQLLEYLHGTSRCSNSIAHACSCMSSFMLCARPPLRPCLLPDAWLAKLATEPGVGLQANAAPCARAGHSVLDTTRNITWHMGNDLVFTLAPSSAADVDRTRTPHISHAPLVEP